MTVAIIYLLTEKYSSKILVTLSLAHLVKDNVSFCHRRFLQIGQSETRIACGGHVC
jgi:hypothetical protein